MEADFQDGCDEIQGYQDGGLILMHSFIGRDNRYAVATVVNKGGFRQLRTNA
jgi:hypothetical protein